jgi:hypothetical protein
MAKRDASGKFVKKGANLETSEAGANLSSPEERQPKKRISPGNIRYEEFTSKGLRASI